MMEYWGKMKPSSGYTLMNRFRILLELTKFRISFLVTFSASAGFTLAGRKEVFPGIWMPALGIFLLAGGACSLNQYQERRIDGLMARTKTRPVPSGRVHAGTALLISLVLISLGSSIIFYEGGWTALVLGLFAVAWYNGFYTHLKRITALAAVPGALTGAVPPVLGWVCGGGNLFDSRIWAVAFFFFIWQVPHFWLLFLDFAEDYERAGLPSLRRCFTPDQLRRIVFLWILSTAVSSLSIPLFGFANSYPALALLLAGAVWIIWNGTDFLRTHSEGTLKTVFRRLNAYVFAVILLLSLDVISSPVFLP